MCYDGNRRLSRIISEGRKETEERRKTGCAITKIIVKLFPLFTTGGVDNVKKNKEL